LKLKKKGKNMTHKEKREKYAHNFSHSGASLLKLKKKGKNMGDDMQSLVQSSTIKTEMSTQVYNNQVGEAR
jgi:hypothetical protein